MGPILYNVFVSRSHTKGPWPWLTAKAVGPMDTIDIKDGHRASYWDSMMGSPEVLIEGLDLEPQARGRPRASLSCVILTLYKDPGIILT